MWNCLRNSNIFKSSLDRTKGYCAILCVCILNSELDESRMKIALHFVQLNLSCLTNRVSVNKDTKNARKYLWRTLTRRYTLTICIIKKILELWVYFSEIWGSEKSRKWFEGKEERNNRKASRDRIWIWVLLWR